MVEAARALKSRGGAQRQGNAAARVESSGYNRPMEPLVPPQITVVIPNYNGAGFLERCLRSLREQSVAPSGIILVDNGSTDASLDIAVRVAPDARVLSLASNKGFAGAVNEGLRAATTDWVAVLNNDTETDPQWIAACHAAIRRHPDAAFLACRIHDDRRRKVLYSAGDCLLRAGIGYRLGQDQTVRADHLEECEVFAACGCAALYRRAALEAVGGFDERYFAYLEDVELGMRFQSWGHQGWYVPEAIVYHVGGGTSGGEFSELAVRLRTRNSLILARSLPDALFWRWLPMIALAQAFWAARALAHGRLGSYAAGIAEWLHSSGSPAPGTREAVFRSAGAFRRAVLASEDRARRDVRLGRGEYRSSFLNWYFRLFPGESREGRER
jgi:GT2 family glycosyltransferase